jgi:hypothetical protein
MKKLLGVFALLSVLVLAACSNVTQKYADKINEAAAAKEHYTVEQVREDLGDEAIDVNLLVGGAIIAVKGVTTLDELEDKIDEGKEIKGIIVYYALGKATKAEYKVITLEDLK